MSRQSSSGTYEFFREHVLAKKDFKLGSRDMNGSKEVVELVANTKTAIGYSGMGYATPAVKMLKVSAKTGRAGRRADRREHAEQDLPIARSLQIYTLGEPQGAVKKLHRLDAVAGRPEDRRRERLRARFPRRMAADDEGIARESSVLGTGGESQLAPRPVRAGRCALPQARRPVPAVVAEKVLEAAIRLCGVSAIIFVVAIFFFVFREAAPVLFSRDFHLSEFLFSTQWYPTSVSNVRYGTLALIAGTFSVTALAMRHRRALRPRRGDLSSPSSAARGSGRR